ncbi:ATP-binding protein (plasmid) [Streptomyces sp. CA-142005]|uniref:ATP-binding protein n=1 Tax=Streptomyces sp. CA-142005 TaxID=3240052 RepID=UPI003D94FF5E
MFMRDALRSPAEARCIADRLVCSAPAAEGDPDVGSFTTDHAERVTIEDGPDVVPSSPVSLLLHLPRAASHVRVARSVVGAWLTYRCQMPGDRADATVLILSELVTNAIQHGRGEHVAVRASAPTGGTINVEVDDFTPSVVPRPTQTDAEAENGRGLWLVRALVEALDGTYQHSLNGTTAQCRIPVQAPDAARSGGDNTK